MSSDHTTVRLTESEWESLLTVIDAIEDHLDCDNETRDTLTALQNKVQRQVSARHTSPA